MPDIQPSAAALAWAARASGTSATVREVQALTGGTHASTHLIRTADPDRELVLRRYAAADDAAYRETRVLTALDGLGGLAPRLLNSDPAGARFGEPAVLISRLPGRADILPADPLPWAARLGRTLARIHAVPLAGITEFRDVIDDIPRVVGRADGPVRKQWVDLAAEPRVLTHFDYWSGNVLWEDGELTGVVDWSGASLAPRGFDVGWCRLDLVLLHGIHVADAFLLAYEDAAGVRVSHRELWDLFAIHRSQGEVENWLPNYHDLGRTDLTRQELSNRHGAWLATMGSVNLTADLGC